jgi:nucleotide-binding universal stress UspA family protein
VAGGLLSGSRLQHTDVASTALADEVSRLEASTPGLKVTSALLHGRLEEALAKACVQVDASLVVVGDTARAPSALPTSTLDRLAYSVEAPLLVVRDQRAFVDWSEAHPLKVMVAFDRSASSAVARDWVARLADFGPIALTATQIFWPLEEYDRRELPIPPVEEGHVAIKRLMANELEREFSHFMRGVTVRCRLEIGVRHVAEQLLDLAGEEQVDLVLLGTHRRRALGRFWSVSHRVMLQAPMAVACVPASTAVPDLSTAPVWRSALVVSDLTEAGARAVACGVSLLELGGTLHVVHVSNEPFSAEREASLARRLVAELPPGLETRDVRAVAHVLHGELDEVVARLTEQVKADVIVVPTMIGSSGEALSGGLAQVLLEQTRRPVLLTPTRG